MSMPRRAETNQCIISPMANKNRGRNLALVCSLILFACCLHAKEDCMTIQGRVHYYGGDGQLRIWHIGTHHDFEPDPSSWDTVMGWLTEGTTKAERERYASPESAVDLFGNFVVCPTESVKQGSVQKARVVSVTNRRYVHAR